MTEIFSLSFIYLGKLHIIAYPWMAKLCESLGLAVHLKVTLESICCSDVFSVNVMTVRCQSLPCFIQRTGIYQTLIMLANHGTNKSEDLRKRVDVAHLAGKGYEDISKEFGLHKSTDCEQMEEIQDHCNPRQKWSTNKDHSKNKTCNSPRGWQKTQGNV